MIEKKTIKIDTEVYGELRKRIQGFSDTPNLVLRRVLNIDISHRSDAKKEYDPKEKSFSKNITGRIEGDRQRKRLKNKYGSKIEGYPILYHAGWPLRGDTIQKYSFGIPVRRFDEQKRRDGFLVFICGKAELTFFIPCKWISSHLKSDKESVTQQKFNIPVSGELYYWMNKKDGIVIDCFKNRVP